MLLNNYKMLFVALQQNTFKNGVNMNGSETTIGVANAYKIAVGQSINYTLANLAGGYSSLDVGFGDTPETASDYNLADGNQNTRLTTVNYGKNVAGVGDIINCFLNVRNDGATNVTVKEIGFYGNANSQTSTGGSNTILLARKVLDTPVTIAPGETYSFTYVLRFKS